MKRVFTVLLAAAMCFSLTACAGSGELEKYKKYDALIDRMEAEDYEGALAEITRMSEKGKDADTPETSQQKEAKSAEIEVTLENWQEYFEINRYLSVRYDKNAFDEPTYTNLELYTVLELKEAFSKEAFSYDTSDVAVEFNVDYRTSDISYDLDDFSFELTDCVSHPNATVNESEFRRQATDRMGGGFWISRDLIVNGKVESHSLSYCIDDRPSGRYATLIDHQSIEQNEDGTGYLRLCPTNIRITRIEGALKYDV